jgi:hypothetical protein
MRFSHIPAALAVLLAAGMVAAIAGCASTTSPVASTVVSRHSEAAVSPSQPAATSPAPAASSPTPAPSGVSNLVVPDPVRSELTAAYVAYMHFNPANIAGTTPRSVYYAYDATTGTYWAMATFQPTKAALGSKPGSPAFNMLVNMQDGGSTGLFSRASGGAWQVQDDSWPPQCAIIKFFPKAVTTVWALQTTSPAGLHCAA